MHTNTLSTTNSLNYKQPLRRYATNSILYRWNTVNHQIAVWPSVGLMTVGAAELGMEMVLNTNRSKKSFLFSLLGVWKSSTQRLICPMYLDEIVCRLQHSGRMKLRIYVTSPQRRHVLIADVSMVNLESS